MSNISEKVRIINLGLLAIGQTEITEADYNSNILNVKANKAKSIFEQLVKGLLGEDWYFNRKRVLLSDLTAVNKLTLDTAPSAAAFVVGATITGVTSTKTCTVLEVLSSKVYLVTEPSGTFTDGETVGDGTNSVDCAAGYPLFEEDLGYGEYDYGYVMPADQLYIRGVADFDYDKAKYPFTPEGNIILTNQTDAFWHYNKWVGYQGSTTICDVTVMRPYFQTLIAAELAYILSPNVTENARIRPKAEYDRRVTYIDAREKNGMEGYFEGEAGNDNWTQGANRELESF